MEHQNVIVFLSSSSTIGSAEDRLDLSYFGDNVRAIIRFYENLFREEVNLFPDNT